MHLFVIEMVQFSNAYENNKQERMDYLHCLYPKAN